MGLREKAKEAAFQSRAKAERARQQGRAKLAEIRASREKSALYRSLGEAVYAERREGGDHAAVDTAFAALDAHHGKADADAADAPPPAADIPPGD